MGEIQDAVDEAVGKGWCKAATIIAVLLAVYIGAGLIFGMWPFSIVAKVANTNAIIQNYQWYYDQYNAIQAQTANLNALPADAPERRGLSMVVNTMIGEYNSRSRQITRNLWKASDLPYSIPLVGGSK